MQIAAGSQYGVVPPLPQPTWQMVAGMPMAMPPPPPPTQYNKMPNENIPDVDPNNVGQVQRNSPITTAAPAGANISNKRQKLLQKLSEGSKKMSNRQINDLLKRNKANYKRGVQKRNQNQEQRRQQHRREQHRSEQHRREQHQQQRQQQTVGWDPINRWGVPQGMLLAAAGPQAYMFPTPAPHYMQIPMPPPPCNILESTTAQDPGRMTKGRFLC